MRRLYQNDDSGKDYLVSLMIVRAAPYAEPTIDSQVVTLQGSGADVFFIAATPKGRRQAVRKSHDLSCSSRHSPARAGTRSGTC